MGREQKAEFSQKFVALVLGSGSLTGMLAAVVVAHHRTTSAVCECAVLVAADQVLSIEKARPAPAEFGAIANAILAAPLQPPQRHAFREFVGIAMVDRKSRRRCGYQVQVPLGLCHEDRPRPKMHSSVFAGFWWAELTRVLLFRGAWCGLFSVSIGCQIVTVMGGDAL